VPVPGGQGDIQRPSPAGWRAISAGTRPAGRPNPRTGPMLEEIGIAVPSHLPALLAPAMMEEATIQVDMGCLDDASCPVRLRGHELRDWDLADPGRPDDDGFRRLRDRVVDRVRRLRTEIVRSDRRAAAITRSGNR
jgi:arsenate reductase (thioredoxin)